MKKEKLQHDDERIVYGIPLRKRLGAILPMWRNIEEYHNYPFTKVIGVAAIVLPLLTVIANQVSFKSEMIFFRNMLLYGLIGFFALMVGLSYLIALIPNRVVLDKKQRQVRQQMYGVWRTWDASDVKQIRFSQYYVAIDFGQGNITLDCQPELQVEAVDELKMMFPDVPVVDKTAD